jgi:hypothetical protein
MTHDPEVASGIHIYGGERVAECGSTGPSLPRCYSKGREPTVVDSLEGHNRHDVSGAAVPLQSRGPSRPVARLKCALIEENCQSNPFIEPSHSADLRLIEKKKDYWTWRVIFLFLFFLKRA